MARKIVYVCDRCKREALEDRSYWADLSVVPGFRGSQNLMLCDICKSEFYMFMDEKTVVK